MSPFKKLFGRKDDDGETPEFKAFVEGSMEGLRLQTQAHQGAWRLGKSERWDFAQDIYICRPAGARRGRCITFNLFLFSARQQFEQRGQHLIAVLPIER
jgi:hypothetical protein